jgi:5-oxoprolinase (ATP-hydrolysing) subunit A
MARIDINCDMGESFGAYRIGNDEAVMPNITSANIACGYHAGDPGVMRKTVRLAKSHGVAVGAHPGFPDLVGFGRRAMAATPAEVEDFCVYQIGALWAIAKSEGVAMQHVKAHGELFNMAMRDRPLADAIARSIASVDPSLILFALPGSEVAAAGRAIGLHVALEVFADRAYEPDGSLRSRRKPGAMVHDPEKVVERAVRMVRDHSVVAYDGSVIPFEADTICVHGDTPGAEILTALVRKGLFDAGITVKAVGTAES